MALTLKEFSKVEERIAPGHRMCAGCGAPVVVRNVLKATEDPVVVACATGCLEVSTTIYPYTSWKTSFIHNAFENASATLSGAEAAFHSLKKQGKIDGNMKFVAFGGDGGTYDIGIQSLSGAMERGHDMVYVCYDNGAYMNTGIQRSSATPRFADTTTSPAGKVIPGKLQKRKDLTAIMVAHNIPYAAQSTPAHWKDLQEKARKAFAIEGPCFLNTLAICPRGWRTDTADGMLITRLAVETCFWPLYEVENGVWRLTYKPKEKKPIEDFLRPQGRFKHLFQKGNEELIAALQADVDAQWEALLKRCEE